MRQPRLNDRAGPIRRHANAAPGRRGRACAAAWAAVLLTIPTAKAGPPYVTDDPEPTRTGGWENYVYLTGTDTSGATAGQGGIDLNYGAARNLQISLTLPEEYLASHGLHTGVGDITLGAKYRFLQASDNSWLPDAAVFPAVTAPSGSRSLGARHASLFLPIWMEKDFGRWSTFGGGGFAVNPDAGQRNYGLLGLAVTHTFGPRLNLGVEAYHQTRTSAGGTALTTIGLGAIYQATRHWAVMASGGPGLERPRHAGAAAFYLSVQFTD